ncbi:MAG: phenylalanine--tRNA ligase subunit alpha, partial [Acidobacteria bacterium]|nr:phenylalanine--tRNA ligase subunit alpha [Acidobacteriota bacterium]
MGVARLDEVRAAFLADLESARGKPEAVETIRVRYAGRRSGLLLELTAALRDLPNEEKRDYGRALNELKKLVAGRLEAAKDEARVGRASGSVVDVTLPGLSLPRGAEHPVHLVRQRIEEIFLRMGYDVEDGPEIEDDWHNFEALNIPPDHPARDDQDTFYVPGGRLLRTHTSPVQARVMEQRKPPIRIIVPGKVYRRDSDLRHSPMFHQIEG